MIGLRKTFLACVAVLVATVSMRAASAVPTVNILNDNGTRVTTTTTQTSTNFIDPLYGSNSLAITPVTNGWRVSFVPNSGFFASANNLDGGMLQILDGQLQFIVTFEAPVNLTTNIFESGIYGKSGNGRVEVASVDVPSGVEVWALDGTPQTISHSFATNAVTNFDPSTGTWSLYDQVTGFNQNHTTYRVVIDNALLAQSPTNQAPGYASIAKKSFSIVFTFDGSSGGGPNIPEPASIGVMALGALALLARRRAA